MATNALRIVHVVCSDGFAGVERYASTAARELAARGHRLTVIGGHADRTTAALAGSAVTHIPARRVDQAARVLVRRARQFDLVHAHMTAAETAAVVTRPVLRCPIVSTRHFAAQRGSTVGGRLLRRPMRHALAQQISISQFVADAIDEPSVLIPGCVPDADAIETSDGVRVVLVAQRLETEKRTGDALEAWAASGLADEGWELWIAGDGAERRALEERGRRLRGIHFLGHRTDIADLRRRSAIMLAPTPTDAFGLSVVEAMSVGLPVVAVDGGGHRETIGPVVPELLYRAGDADACAQLLRGLAYDADRRRRLGAELRSFQQRELGVERHVDRLVELYASVIEARASTRASSGHAA